jgi:serine/threonine protein kinase
MVCREMRNMIQIGEHQNIIDLIEVLELIQDTRTTLFLVLELITGGELFDKMKSGGIGNTEDFARKYFNQLIYLKIIRFFFLLFGLIFKFTPTIVNILLLWINSINYRYYI